MIKRMVRSMISYREYLVFLLIVLPFSVAIFIQQVLFNYPELPLGCSREMAEMLNRINVLHGLVLSMGHYILSTLPLAFWAALMKHHPSLLFSCSWAAAMYLVVKLCQIAA